MYLKSTSSDNKNNYLNEYYKINIELLQKYYDLDNCSS